MFDTTCMFKSLLVSHQVTSQTMSLFRPWLSSLGVTATESDSTVEHSSYHQHQQDLHKIFYAETQTNGLMANPSFSMTVDHPYVPLSPSFLSPNNSSITTTSSTPNDVSSLAVNSSYSYYYQQYYRQLIYYTSLSQYSGVGNQNLFELLGENFDDATLKIALAELSSLYTNQYRGSKVRQLPPSLCKLLASTPSSSSPSKGATKLNDTKQSIGDDHRKPSAVNNALIDDLLVATAAAAAAAATATANLNSNERLQLANKLAASAATATSDTYQRSQHCSPSTTTESITATAINYNGEVITNKELNSSTVPKTNDQPTTTKKLILDSVGKEDNDRDEGLSSEATTTTTTTTTTETVTKIEQKQYGCESANITDLFANKTPLDIKDTSLTESSKAFSILNTNHTRVKHHSSLDKTLSTTNVSNTKQTNGFTTSSSSNANKSINQHDTSVELTATMNKELQNFFVFQNLLLDNLVGQPQLPPPSSSSLSPSSLQQPPLPLPPPPPPQISHQQLPSSVSALNKPLNRRTAIIPTTSASTNAKIHNTLSIGDTQKPKKFVCIECKSGFSNRSQLNSHFRTHTGERPFVCDYKNCQKSFTRNEELTRHRRIHSGIRPYPCRWCEKRFGRKDHLRKHERTHERRLRSSMLLNYCTNSLTSTGGATISNATAVAAASLPTALQAANVSFPNLLQLNQQLNNTTHHHHHQSLSGHHTSHRNHRNRFNSKLNQSLSSSSSTCSSVSSNSSSLDSMLQTLPPAGYTHHPLHNRHNHHHHLHRGIASSLSPPAKLAAAAPT